MTVFAKAYLCPSSMRPEEVKRDLLSRNPGSIVQTMKSGDEKNEFFLEMLAAQTLLAESTGALLAKKPEVDFLLRLAGTTQISRAISLFGARGGDQFVAFVASRRAISIPKNLVRFELERRELSKKELNKIEKAALLDAERA